ncbi:MAG TPA: iron-sulfur cluster assembly protein [bacterium]|jgi:metal-sulfur cluster biosynthetic enzyme
MATPEDVYNALAKVYDPELALPVTDLGLVYDIQVVENRAEVKMTLTTMGCPMAGSITDMAKRAIIQTVPGIEDATVEIIWDPPWSIDMMSDEARMRLGLM